MSVHWFAKFWKHTYPKSKHRYMIKMVLRYNQPTELLSKKMFSQKYTQLTENSNKATANPKNYWAARENFQTHYKHLKKSNCQPHNQIIEQLKIENSQSPCQRLTVFLVASYWAGAGYSWRISWHAGHTWLQAQCPAPARCCLPRCCPHHLPAR